MDHHDEIWNMLSEIDKLLDGHARRVMALERESLSMRRELDELTDALAAAGIKVARVDRAETVEEGREASP